MIPILVFELSGSPYALLVEDVDRVLSPGEPLPADVRLVDLARICDLAIVPALDDPREGFRALRADRRLAVRMGAPAGPAEVAAGWILPLPGYMFDGPMEPFRGILEIPPEAAGRKGLRRAQRCLLLDAEILAEMALRGER
ncbi:MAG: hypothetical protein ACE5HU_04490 [Acidobacteriota bacterium]